MKRRLALASILMAACLPGHAGTLPEPLADGMRGCARESDAAQRLACFDALAAQLPKVQADEFGMTREIAKKRDPVATVKKEQEVLPAKITALSQTQSGRYVFTLDNQQVWLQQEVQPNLKFDVGDPVRIKHGALGSLYIAADGHRMTRVKRLE